LLFGILIILFINNKFEKYTLTRVSYRWISPITLNHWTDLDNDGFSEEVNIYNTPPQPVVIIRKNSRIIGQWVLHGEAANMQYFFSADYDSDKINEFYLIAISGDSLIINGIIPFQKPTILFLKRFLDTYNKSVLGNDCAVYFIKATDINGDGYRELIFSITTGWSAYPRKIYAVDIKNNTVLTTPRTCTPMINPVSFDVNGDGFDEYIPESYGFGNCAVDEPYSDNNAYIMLFDRKLDFMFKPVSAGQFKSIVITRPIRAGSKVYLVALRIHCGIENIQNKLFIYDIEGKKIKEKILMDFKSMDNSILLNMNELEMDKVFLILNNGLVLKTDTALRLEKVTQIEGPFSTRNMKIDADQDGIDEFIFCSDIPSRYTLIHNDFSDPVEISTPEVNEKKSLAVYVSVQKRGRENPLLYFQNGGHCYFFDYHKNLLFSFKYPIYAGILIVLFFIFFLIQKAQIMRERLRYEKEKEFAELQLKAVKGQTDPHFTLNLLNSLWALYDRKDKEKADHVFGKYVKLLRTTILDSESLDRSLGSEIEYVRSYLDLEKFRYSDKFNYQISLDTSVDPKILVPKMLIHTFVENAVKHGIKHLDKDGFISLEIAVNLGYYLVTIKDNGVGRKKSSGYSPGSTGQGIKILDNILKLYSELKMIRISYDISDIEDENHNVAGTFVRINIPVERRMKLI